MLNVTQWFQSYF